VIVTEPVPPDAKVEGVDDVSVAVMAQKPIVEEAV
jgi:hypothetical protein